MMYRDNRSFNDRRFENEGFRFDERRRDERDFRDFRDFRDDFREDRRDRRRSFRSRICPCNRRWR